MLKILNTKTLWAVSVPTICIAFFTFVYAENHKTNFNKNYFAVKNRQDKVLLSNVERHHLTREKFWKWYNAGKYHYALEELKFVLRYFPNHPKALQLLGGIAVLTKDPTMPIPYYRKALRLYPQHALTYAQFGNYLANIGFIDDGLARLRIAIKKNPKLAVAHAWIAEAYDKGGHPELARQAAEQARALGYQGKIGGKSKEK